MMTDIDPARLARLRKAIHQQNVSAVARAAGVSRAYIYLVIAGRSIPSHEVAQRIADAADVDLLDVPHHRPPHLPRAGG